MALFSASSICRRCLLLLAVHRCTSQWTSWVTDGSAAAACPPSSVMAGFQCKGRYCDDMSLYCQPTNANLLQVTYTDYFSEEGAHHRICPNGGFVSGLEASGRYSDNLKLRCSVMAALSPKKCVWTSGMSEEMPFPYIAPISWYVAGMACEGRYCDDVTLLLCNVETADVTPAAYAELHAPLLRFDSLFASGSGDSLKCFPSDPQKYIDGRKRNMDPQVLCNLDYGIIVRNDVPIFYVPQRSSDNRFIVIRYFWFFAYQSTCMGDKGSHPADWESIAVVLDYGTLVRTTFYQHGGYYSKVRGHFSAVGTHPVVYVGKNSHGSYHDAGGIGGCCYFADFRKPGSPNYHMNTWNNLALLTRNGTHDWMNCKGDCFDGISHPLDQMRNEYAGCENIDTPWYLQLLCRMADGEANGCERSDNPASNVFTVVEF